jgi:hypothetical protein
MTGHSARTALAIASAVLVSACSAAPPAEEQPAPTRTSDPEMLPPPGYGTLRQDDFTIQFARGPVQIKVTPLDERVIRLAAPDTYQRLHGMVASRSERIRQMAETAGVRGEPKVFLVSFFTREKQASFEPTSLQLLSQGILFFPRGILPLTPEWGRQQLKQEESQSALYLFDPAIDLNVAFEVDYQGARSFGWTQIIRTLQAERGRVVSRVKR